MRVVFSDAPPDLEILRRKLGLDTWDEMWEGVMHVPPAPTAGHQDFSWHLETWLRTRWKVQTQGKVFHEVNLAMPGQWPGNYRIPDILLLLPDCFHINKGKFFEGVPSAVIEIHSPGDESYEKLPFYLQLGVPEVWIIDRDSKRPEVYVLQGDRYISVAPDADGWLLSPRLGLEARQVREGKLAIRLHGQATSVAELPTDD